MSRHVIAYSDLRSFKESEAFMVLRNMPQIAVQHTLIEAMFKDETSGDMMCDYDATTFNEFLHPIIEPWSSPQTMVEQLNCIKKYIKSRIDPIKGIEEKKEELVWLKACRKNAFSILSSIILFEEAGIRPEDLPDVNRNIIILKQAWNYLFNKDYSIFNFRTGLYDIENGHIDDLLLRSFNTNDVDTIVIHGFFFITPLQERVFRALEKKGINLLFLNCYDAKYPYAHEVFDYIFSTDKGFDDKSEWTLIGGEEVNPIGELLENREPSLKNVTILNYATLYDFSKGIDAALTTGYKIFSPDQKTANELMMDFFPDRYKDRSLLNYPVGQFILLLHRMWDPDDKLILTPDLMEECLSSGWIDIDGHNSREIISDYQKIKTYFRDCIHIEDWQSRLKKLEVVMHDLDDEFILGSDNRWQEIMGNPFHSFSTFNISQKSIELIGESINTILDIASKLFSEEEVSISNHLERLKKVLQMHGHTEDLYEDEKRVITTLFMKMKTLRSKKYSPDSILDAITIFLGGTLDDPHANEIDFDGMIGPMFKIDGAYATGEGLIHICICDLKRLPGKTNNYVWPLSKEVLLEVCNRIGSLKHPLSNAIDIIETTPLNNRYLLCLAAKARNLVISWVSQMDGKELRPSPYIVLMKDRCGKKINLRNSATLKEIYESDYEVPSITHFNINETNYTAPEAKKEYAVCGLRYLYGYILERYPTYSSDFHQTFILEGLLKSMNLLFKDRPNLANATAELIISWLDNLRASEKRQLLDNAMKVQEGDFKDTDFADTLRYTGLRFLCEFPKPILGEMDQEFRKIQRPEGRKYIDINQSATSSKICMYCPHAEYCKNTQYAVDNGGKYGKE